MLPLPKESAPPTGQKKMGIKRKATPFVAQMMSEEDYPLRGYTERSPALSHETESIAIAPPSPDTPVNNKDSSKSNKKPAKAVEEDTHLERFIMIPSLLLSTTIQDIQRILVDLNIHVIYIYFDPESPKVHAYIKMETVSGARLAVRHSDKKKGIHVISLTPLEAVMADKKWIRLEENMDLTVVRQIFFTYLPMEIIKRLEARRAATDILTTCSNHEATRQCYVNVEAKQLAKRLLSIRHDIGAMDYFFSSVEGRAEVGNQNQHCIYNNYQQLLLELRTVQLQVMMRGSSNNTVLKTNAECHFIANLLTKWINWIEVQKLFLLQEQQTAAVTAFIH